MISLTEVFMKADIRVVYFSKGKKLLFSHVLFSSFSTIFDQIM